MRITKQKIDSIVRSAPHRLVGVAPGDKYSAAIERYAKERGVEFIVDKPVPRPMNDADVKRLRTREEL